MIEFRPRGWSSSGDSPLDSRRRSVRGYSAGIAGGSATERPNGRADPGDQMFEFLKGLFGGATVAKSDKLGSEADPIRQLLFASQTLREQVSHMRPDGRTGPMQSIAEAQRLVDEGQAKEAIARLRGVLDSPALETRIQLWVWSALRELGERPEGRSAFEVLGAVLEVPSGGAYDTLAGYVDGSARYLNFSGKVIFWDAQDPAVKQLCQGLVDSTVAASRKAKPRTSLSLPKRGIQATMLTRSGPFLIAAPSQAIVNAGGALMLELIRRAEEKAAAAAVSASAG
jgi:hypothetical protein